MAAANKDKPLRIASLTIHNVLGLADAEITPGKVTLIEGANGKGKTSILESIRAVLKGGHDGSLLRKGEENAEIVLVLDNGFQITKRITADASDTTIRDADGVKVAKPASVLDRLRDAFALNPVDFLTETKPKRLALFLGALPMKVDASKLATVMESCSIAPDLDGHALQVLGAIQKDIYDQRTGVNRVIKEKRVTAEEMKKALPAGVLANNGALEFALTEAKTNQKDFLEESQSTIDAINKSADKQKAAAQRSYSERFAELTNAKEAELKRIEVAYQQDLAGIQNIERASLELVSESRSRQIAEETANREASLKEFADAIATAEAQLTTHAATESTRTHIAELEKSAKLFEAKSQKHSAALEELDTILAGMLEKLPIKGCTVKEGDIYVDGVPFDRVNTAKRVGLAFDLCALRSGRLPVMAVDGIESLDTESRMAIVETAVDRNVQLFLARVTDGPLEITNLVDA